MSWTPADILSLTVVSFMGLLLIGSVLFACGQLDGWSCLQCFTCGFQEKSAPILHTADDEFDFIEEYQEKSYVTLPLDDSIIEVNTEQNRLLDDVPI